MAAKVLLFLLIGSSALVAAEEDSKSHPVSKVITLLKDMIVQLDKEGKEDAEIFENIGCWCETNEKEKTKSIREAEQRITSLTAAIEEYTGESARLNTEVANLNKEITKNQQALDTATALRTKQLAEFNEEEKDMLQSITSLKNAVISLSKHNSAMLQGRNPFMSKTVMLQVPDSESISVIVGLHETLHKQSDKIKQAITPEQRRILENFVQNPDSYSGESFVQKPRSGLAQEVMKLKEKAPQSGEIFGILSAMKESFETNLANSQREEAENLKSYEDLKAAKESEISTGMNQASTKSTQLASSDEKNAQSKEDLEDTQETLSADTAFLADVKDKCTNSDQEFEQRTKTRQLEIEAVTKALSFLTSDEAHELMTRTFNPALVQLSSVVSSRSSTRMKVAELLQRVADKVKDPRLSTIALKVRMDAFQKVKDTMTKMIDHLLKEKDDEIKHKDVCIENFNKNDRATEVATQNRDDLQAKIDDDTATIDDLNKSIETLQAEIAEMKKQLKYAGEDRELANKDFQITVADQRATQKLLTASLNVLKGFYEKSALLQRQSQPPSFKKYQKNENAGGVMGMIQSIIDDAKAMEADAIRAEEDAQEDYEAFVKETNEGLEERGKSLMNKQSTKGKTEKSKVESEVERDEEIAELQLLASELHDIHIDCDFLMKNWEIRVTARDEEIEALKQGIAMFSGASFSSLAQHYQGPF